MTKSVEEIICTIPPPPNHGPWIAGEAPKGSTGVSVLVCQERDRVIAYALRLEDAELASVEDRRMCLACGATRSASLGREVPGEGCKSPDACTWDLTEREALEHWRKAAHDLRQERDALGAENERLREDLRAIHTEAKHCRSYANEGSADGASIKAGLIIDYCKQALKGGDV